MDDKGERLGVHLVDQAVEPLDFRFGVGRIAEQAERSRRRDGVRAAGEKCADDGEGV
jgi:hypothetical protein